MVAGVYFVRHGESVANAGGVTMDERLVPLNGTGLAQAASIAGRLRFKATEVLVSELIRTQQTAKPYCDRHGLTPAVHPLLNEMSVIDASLIQGMTGDERRPISEAYWAEADPDRRMGDRADTFREFGARVQRFRTELLPTLKPDAVCFVHGHWLGMLVWQVMGFYLGMSPDMRGFKRFSSGLPMPNCAVYRFQSADKNEWSVRFC
ncbi:MAG: histidine phosphatase family protein [Synergistaceae bacterium]|jgi:broad specificity phosphatase PhoE|nr:histidine phosphatase family protein [Synergistaceae bacterium]